MATYYGIFGQKVQYLASDPSDVQIGQVWYNSTSATLKVRTVTTVGTWASGGSLNTSRKGRIGGAGTQTAALGFGGNPGSSPYTTNVTESYNGTSWTTSPGTLNTSRAVPVSGGTQTSAIAAASNNNSVATETWNGTSWTSVANMGTARYYVTGTGTTSSAFAAGGTPNGTVNVATTETWNGSSWTAGGNLANPTSFAASVGTAADGLSIAGGQASPAAYYNYTQKYNGLSWTSLATINTTRRSLSASSTGPTSSAVIFGGEISSPSLTSATENWNGTSWTSNPNGLSTARDGMGGVGTQAAALAFGGATPSATGVTEEYTGPGAGTTKTVTVS